MHFTSNLRRRKVLILHRHVLVTPVSQTTCCLRLVFAAPRGYLKKQLLLWCDLHVWDNWGEMVKDRGAWRCLVWVGASNFNNHNEAHEKDRKDWWRREERRALNQHSGLVLWRAWVFFFCGEVKQDWSTISGRDMAAWSCMVMERVALCDTVFQNLGITMHSGYCEANLNRELSWASWWMGTVPVACTHCFAQKQTSRCICLRVLSLTVSSLIDQVAAALRRLRQTGSRPPTHTPERLGG